MIAYHVLILLTIKLFVMADESVVTPAYESDCVTMNTDFFYNTSLDTMLNILESNTELLLSDGCHKLTQYRLVRNLTNITLKGESNEVIITCEGGTGLAFFNITNLALENVIIKGCSLVGNKNLRDALTVVNKTIAIFHQVIDNTKVAIFLADINSLSMINVTVKDNIGIGVLAINIMGTSFMTEVTFMDNKPPLCTVFLSSAGGGLLLLYTDYKNDSNVPTPTLTISNSYFLDNEQCSVFVVAPLVYYLSPSVRNLGLRLEGGGGMSLILSPSYFSVNVTIIETEFKRNKGLNGGGIHIDQYQGVSGSYIFIDDCSFEENGFEDLFSRDMFVHSIGGAIAIIMNTEYDNELEGKVEVIEPSVITVRNTSFIKNRGYWSAGVFLYALNSPLTTIENENRVVFSDCKFSENIATISPVITAVEKKFDAFELGVQLHLHNIKISNNKVSQLQRINQEAHDAIITLASINVTISGESVFSNNKASPLLSDKSIINFKDSIRFENNSATSGGAIVVLTGSYLVIKNNTNLNFVNNLATSYGGAIYFIHSGPGIQITDRSCFMWFEKIDPFCGLIKPDCTDPGTLNITVNFKDNAAQLGSTIYGSTQQSCPWYDQYKKTYKISGNVSGFELLSRIPSDKFMFQLRLNNNRVINTNAIYLSVSDIVGNNDSNPIPVFPGETIIINVTALDDLNQTVPLAIASQISANTNGSFTSSQLGLSGYWFLAGDNVAEPVQATIFGSNSTNISISLYSISSSASSAVYVELQDCLYGFTFQNNSCVCSPDIQQSHDQFDDSFVGCNQTTGYITIPRFFWFGITPVNKYTLHSCIMDYCTQGAVSFRGKENIDTQCDNNRAGILCGKCAGELSIVFGSNKCLTCPTDARIFGFILLFLLMGIVLVLVIAFLNFTVTEGYLNGVIFYSNIINFFIPNLAPFNSKATIIFIFISWINFSPGVETCIYNGMDSLARTGLTFLFPLYLFFLMFVIVFLARRSKRISKGGFSATRAFATLLLLCYTSIATTCVELLSFIKIHGPSGTYVGWRTDPNIIYGNGVHGFLVFVAVGLLVFYIIPFSLILLCPPYVLSRTRLGQYLILHFKAIFDAFWNPFKPKFTFWIGFRCVIRVPLLIIVGTTNYPENTFSIAVFVACLLFLHETLQPFKGRSQNRIETYFMINLLLLVIGGLYYPRRSDEDFDDLSSDFYIIILVLFAYGCFIFVGIFHIYIRFPQILPALKKTAMKCYKCRCCKKKEETKDDTTSTVPTTIITLEKDIIIPKVYDPSLLRESLLESGGSILLKEITTK